MDDFFKGVQEKKEEFDRDYKPELERRRAEREQEKKDTRQRELDKMMKDMKVGGAGTKPKSRPKKEEPETVSDAEASDEDGMDHDDLDYEEELDSDDPEKGLKERYKQAIRDHGPGEGDDNSFARMVNLAKYT
jgi:hypothetical protein